MRWWQISFLLSSYGFFHEYKPSEPFVFQYYMESKGVTEDEYNDDISTVGQYVSIGLLIFIFLFTDYVRYKPVVILGAVFGVICFSIQTWCVGLWRMQITDAFFGAFTSCEVAYYTYIYAKVDKKYYQRVTGHARAAYMFGRCIGGITAQLCVSHKALNYQQLHYISVSSLVVAVIIACLLPSVPQSTYFHRKIDKEGGVEVLEKTDPESVSSKPPIPKNKMQIAFTYIRQDFIDAFTNWYVIKWSIWWALATSIFLQVSSFGQILWTTIADEEHETLSNGYVEFCYTLLGALSAFVMGLINIRWDKYGDLLLAVFSLIQGVGLFASSYMHTLIPVYVFYILNGSLYEAAITIATSEVAKQIREDSFALVFGVNMFFSILMQVILSSILLKGVRAPIRTQFKVYGGYYLVLAAGFGALTIYSLFRHCKRKTMKEESK